MLVDEGIEHQLKPTILEQREVVDHDVATRDDQWLDVAEIGFADGTAMASVHAHQIKRRLEGRDREG